MPTTSVAPLEYSCGPRYPGASGEGRDLGHLVRVRLIHRARLLSCQVLGPLIGVQVPEEKVERNRNSMVLALQRLEDKFLRDRAFIAGQQVTLADLMSLEELIQV